MIYTYKQHIVFNIIVMELSAIAAFALVMGIFRHPHPF